MRTTFISTATLWNSPRSSLDKLQENLTKANTEVTTGRHADVGLTLGHQTGEALSLRQQRAELDTLQDANTSATLRLKSTNTSLDRIREIGDSFKNSLIGMPAGDSAVQIVFDQSRSHLSTMISLLNTTAGGQYIFGGTNTKEKPLEDYTGGASPSASKLAVDAVFSQAPPSGFGISQSDPGVSAITPDQMKAFLADGGPFESLFKGANWSNWSNASDQNIRSLISPAEKFETSVNANETAFQKMAMAYTMVLDLGFRGLSEETRQVVINKAVETLSKAVTGVIDIQADLGIVQEKIDSANERMDLQRTIFDERIGKLESVDPAEAKIRVDQLMTQIQTSYSLTAQLRQLSLINFL